MKITNLGLTEDNELKINVGSVHNVDRTGFESFLKLDNPYFLSCEFDSDGDFTLYYDFGSKITVKKYLSKEISAKEACAFLKALADVMIETEKLNMDENCIMMNANAMFFDEAEQMISVVYVPLIEGITPAKTLRLFLKEILINMLYKENDDMAWLGNIIRYISRNRHISPADFRDFVTAEAAKLDAPAVAPAPQPAPAVAPVPQPAPAVAPVAPAIQSAPVAAPQPAPVSKAAAPVIEDDDDVKGILTRLSSRQGYELPEGETTVGKSADNMISIPDNRAISRKHAVLIKVGNAFMIKDCGSTNHTYVNGVELAAGQEIDLNSGDRVHFANEEFIFTTIE